MTIYPEQAASSGQIHLGTSELVESLYAWESAMGKMWTRNFVQTWGIHVTFENATVKSQGLWLQDGPRWSNMVLGLAYLAKAAISNKMHLISQLPNTKGVAKCLLGLWSTRTWFIWIEKSVSNFHKTWIPSNHFLLGLGFPLLSLFPEVSFGLAKGFLKGFLRLPYRFFFERLTDRALNFHLRVEESAAYQRFKLLPLRLWIKEWISIQLLLSLKKSLNSLDF